MAEFQLCYGLPPSEYRALTRLQREAFHRVARRINDERKRRR